MPTTPRSLILIVYAPALVSGDVRPLDVVREMERAFPGLRLEWTISSDGRLVPLPQRDVWVAQGRPDGRKGFRLVCSSDENYLVTLSGWERPAGISSGGHAQFEVHAELPLDVAGIAAAVDVLESMGEATGAFWGRATPDGVGAELAQQTRHSINKPHVPPRGLPALKLTEEIRSPEIPHQLGWLNYWSAATAKSLGFPDPARDADLLSRARRTATGGWIVRLTNLPLDLDDSSHLEALLRAYARFPEIGGRVTPR
jgi:hypothetical protein